jgi:hypothetical protein
MKCKIIYRRKFLTNHDKEWICRLCVDHTTMKSKTCNTINCFCHQNIKLMIFKFSCTNIKIVIPNTWPRKQNLNTNMIAETQGWFSNINNSSRVRKILKNNYPSFKPWNHVKYGTSSIFFQKDKNYHSK